MPKGPDHTTRCGALSPRLFPSPLSLLRIPRNVRGSQTSAQRFPWPWLSFTRRTDFNKHSAEWADNVTINTKKTRNLRTDWHSGDRWWSTAVVVAFRVGNEGSRERGEWKPRTGCSARARERGTHRVGYYTLNTALLSSMVHIYYCWLPFWVACDLFHLGQIDSSP